MDFLSDSDSDFELIDEIRAPKQRMFHERISYLDTLDDYNFHRRFRITKDTFRFLLDKIREGIAPSTARSVKWKLSFQQFQYF